MGVIAIGVVQFPYHTKIGSRAFHKLAVRFKAICEHAEEQYVVCYCLYSCRPSSGDANLIFISPDVKH